MSLVRLSNVTREIGTFVILDAVNAAVAVGERVGIVGPNGAGKTTLLRIVAGVDEADMGEVQRRRALTVGLLAQEAHFDEAFASAPDLRTAVRRGAAAVEAMEARLQALEEGGAAGTPAYADLANRFAAVDGWTLDQRVDEALSGLGFTPAEIARSPEELSGGQQTRAALARLLVADPDLLLLDEPTNHLDLSAIEWLEEAVRRRRGALLVASHDRNSTAEVSESESTAGVGLLGQRLLPAAQPVGAAPVVNDPLAFAARALPAKSLTPLAPPLTVTV